MKNTGTLTVTTPSDNEVLLTRVFDAPRQRVYDAFTKPELLKRWFGPRGWSLTTCEVDLRVGGGFRFVLSGPHGNMGMRGVYRELNPPDRSVHVETFDDYPGESIVTSVFTEDAEGRTTLNATVQYPSKEVRDIVIKSGMEHGAAESYDRLAELLHENEAAAGAS